MSIILCYFSAFFFPLGYTQVQAEAGKIGKMMVGAVFELNQRRQKLEISLHVKQKAIKDLFVPISRSSINKCKST